MTNNEAIETIRGCLGVHITPYSAEMEAFGMAIEALERHEKYRWHDLREDPNDLPETCDEVLVVTSSGWFCGTMATAYYNPIKRSNFVVNTEGVRIGEDENRAGYKPWDDVIAWKYIEQFGGES